MCKKRLDIRDRFPSGMEEYLATYGWHFSKKLCELACSKMRKYNPSTKKVESTDFWGKEKVEDLLRRYAIDPSQFSNYDHVYVANMAKNDFLGSSITDEQRLAYYIKDYLTDPDGYDEVAMTRWYADMIGMGVSISWDDVL